MLVGLEEELGGAQNGLRRQELGIASGQTDNPPSKRVAEDRLSKAETTIVAPFSFRGEGQMWVDVDGLLSFLPHTKFPDYAVGFDLNFDEATLEAAAIGEVDLPDVWGLLELQYDPRTQDLKVRATDEDTGMVHEGTYRLNGKGEKTVDEVREIMVQFFAYMRGERTGVGEIEGDDPVRAGEQVAGDTSVNGPSCSCSASHCQCSIACKNGQKAQCRCWNPDKCQCTCLKKLV